MAQRQAIYNLKVDTQGSDKKVNDMKRSMDNLHKSTKKTETANQSFEQQLKDLDKSLNSSDFHFRDLNKKIQDYQTIAIKAGRDTPVGREAIKQAAALKDRMTDLNNEVKRTAQDGQAMQGALAIGTSVVAGYTAFQGVTAMLGVENEELMETMVKLQGAQSVLMSLEQIRASLEKESVLMATLRNAKTKITIALTWAHAAAQKVLNIAIGKGSKAAKLFRVALISTGVGALVVGIAMLIAHFDKIIAAVRDAVDRFNKMGEGFKLLISIIFPFVGLIRLVIAALEHLGIIEDEAQRAQRKRHEERLKQLNEQISKLGELQKKFTEKADHAIAMAKAEGKETHDLEMRKLEGVKKALRARMLMEIKAVETRLALGEKVTEEELKAIREIRDEYVKTKNAIAVKEAEHQTKIRNEQEKSLEQQQKSREKAAEERRRKAEEEAKLQLELERTIQDLMIENIEDANLRKLAKLELEHRRERQQLIEKYGKETELLKELEIKQSNDLKAIRDEIKNSEKEKEKAELEAAREEELLRLENDLMLMEEDFQTKLEKERELEIARRNMLLENDELTEQERRKIRIDSDKKIAEINQQEVERQKATDAAIKASKESLVTAFSGVYSSLKGLVDENSKLGKAMALTEIAVNTAIGFSKGLVIAQSSAAGTGPGAAVAFPIFYAQQIAAVIGAASQAKKILGTAPGISSSGGGGITAPSSGGGGGSAIAPPDVNDRNENEGSLTSDSDFADNAPQKVFVTETDISRTQQRSKDIRVRSTY